MKWNDFLKEDIPDQTQVQIVARAQLLIEERRRAFRRERFKAWLGWISLSAVTAGLAGIWLSNRKDSFDSVAQNDELFVQLVDAETLSPGAEEDLDVVADLDLFDELENIEEWNEKNSPEEA